MSFDEKVWHALKKIPHGKVCTYALLASAVGSPKAFRAVGNACNKNKNAPVLPCHRIVCSNGFVGGYSGGIKKKKKLLQSEGIIIKNNKILNFNEVLLTKKELK